jgi:hypothetical protein
MKAQNQKLAQKPKRAEEEYRRDENILCAILALLKELDRSSLEFVMKDCSKRIAKMDQF